MNYNLQKLDEPGDNFAARFPLSLWQYVVPPRKPEDALYITYLDFAEDPLFSFADYYKPISGDVLEIFELRRRVLFTGVQIEIVQPAEGLIIRPVTNSGIIFQTIPCDVRSRTLYAVDGGVVDRATDIDLHSRLIDDPDYFGLKIESGSVNLTQLALRIELAVSDEYSAFARTNYNRL